MQYFLDVWACDAVACHFFCINLEIAKVKILKIHLMDGNSFDQDLLSCQIDSKLELFVFLV